MPFDWRASPQTAQMFGPSGVFAPFYMRQAQQFQVLQQQQSRQFQEKQQRAAFDYSKGLAEYRQRLQEESPLYKAEAEQATEQAQQAGDIAAIGAQMREAVETGDYDKAAMLQQGLIAQYAPQQWQPPQAVEEPGYQYLLSREGEELAKVRGPFKVAGEPAGAAGAGVLTPSQALTGQNQSISRFGAELDKRPASRIIQKRTGGKKTLNEFFALFSGKYTTAKERLLNEILVEMIETGDVPEGTTIESHPILSAARNLLDYGRIIAGGKVESTLEGKPAPLFP